jgi:hypothetical protein
MFHALSGREAASSRVRPTDKPCEPCLLLAARRARQTHALRACSDHLSVSRASGELPHVVAVVRVRARAAQNALVALAADAIASAPGVAGRLSAGAVMAARAHMQRSLAGSAQRNGAVPNSFCSHQPGSAHSRRPPGQTAPAGQGAQSAPEPKGSSAGHLRRAMAVSSTSAQRLQLTASQRTAQARSRSRRGTKTSLRLCSAATARAERWPHIETPTQFHCSQQRQPCSRNPGSLTAIAAHAGQETSCAPRWCWPQCRPPALWRPRSAPRSAMQWRAGTCDSRVESSTDQRDDTAQQRHRRVRQYGCDSARAARDVGLPAPPTRARAAGTHVGKRMLIHTRRTAQLTAALVAPARRVAVKHSCRLPSSASLRRPDTVARALALPPAGNATSCPTVTVARLAHRGSTRLGGKRPADARAPSVLRRERDLNIRHSGRRQGHRAVCRAAELGKVAHARHLRSERTALRTHSEPAIDSPQH